MATLKLDVRTHIEAMLPIVADEVARIAYLTDNGIPQPKAKNEQGYQARLLCPQWWRRALDRLNSRNIESDQIETGKVHAKASKYASDYAVVKTAKRQHDNAKFIENQALISDADDILPMSEVVRGSVANPNNRRAELMIRMAGFEAYAMTHGYVGEFYTLTCPSKYHRHSHLDFVGPFDCKTDPKSAQQYLCEQWAKIRAEWGRRNVRPFGFRVAEPHHDGCPHWHMLLFIKPWQRRRVRYVMSQYALEIDGNEPGADKHRFKAVQIDPNQGTATGYIAKYISKNLGFSIDPKTIDDPKQTDYGLRVKAWSSVWGIRQFQQIGGAPVTVWRELRKLADEQGDEVLEAARRAADESRWADFLEIMGGAVVRRDDLAVKLKKNNMVDLVTGEVKVNVYGEIQDVITGLCTVMSDVRTKIKNWVMVPGNQLLSIVMQTGGQARSAAAGLQAWSPVNNCTA